MSAFEDCAGAHHSTAPEDHAQVHRVRELLAGLTHGVIVADAATGTSVLHGEQMQKLNGGPLALPCPWTGAFYFPAFHLDGRPYTREESPLYRTLRHGEVVHEEEILMDYPTRRAVVRCDSVPIRGANGAITAAVMTFHDVTERVRAEQAVRFLADASTVLNRSIDYDATLDSLARLVVPRLADLCLVRLRDDADDGLQVRAVHSAVPVPAERIAHLHTFASPPAASPLHGVVTQGVSVLYPEVPEGFYDTYDDPAQRETVRSLGMRSAIFVALRARGRIIGSLSLVMIRPGFAYGPSDLAIVEDLAQRAALAVDNARLYRASQQAAAARDTVLSVVAHDLRSPLSAIHVAAASAQRAASAATGNVAGKLEVISRATRRMRRLIDDLLDVTRLEAKGMQLERSRYAPADVVREALDTLRLLAQEKQLRLVVEVPAGLPLICGDRERLSQVFSNLVGNALKFTPAGGTITVSARAVDGAVRFAVDDTGPGIEAQDLARVFDRFWQARGTARHGTGLGLAIVKGVVEAHGGAVGAQSEPGAGSTFWFTIPAASVKAAATLEAPKLAAGMDAGVAHGAARP